LPKIVSLLSVVGWLCTDIFGWWWSTSYWYV